jgi:hypothetical protein
LRSRAAARLPDGERRPGGIDEDGEATVAGRVEGAEHETSARPRRATDGRIGAVDAHVVFHTGIGGPSSGSAPTPATAPPSTIATKYSPGRPPGIGPGSENFQPNRGS